MTDKHSRLVITALRFFFLFIALGFLSGCMTHYITLRSDPDAVSVVDLTRGELGTTPLKQAVRRGETLHLTFAKEGYTEVKRDVLNIKKNESIMVTLHSFPTLLFVESIPPGATIQVYNVEDNLPVTMKNPTKIHSPVFYTNRLQEIPSDLRDATIVLEKKGYKTLTTTIKLEPYIQNSFSFQMEPLFATLSVNSEPPGAEVYERKAGFLGRTPLNLDLNWEQLSAFSQLHDTYNLQAVDLHLTISKDGYQPKSISKKLYIYLDNPPVNVPLVRAE